MKKIALLAAAAAGLLALAATAQAKEIVGFKLCGSSGCTESSQHVGLDATTSASTTTPGRFYELELRFGEGGTIIHREQAYWLPDSGFMRFKTAGDGSWWKPADLSGLRETATGVEAFVPTLDRVTVGGQSAADPSSYLALLGTFHWAFLPKAKLHLTRIVLRTSTPNPWVDRVASMGYDAKRRLLVRSDGYYRIPAALGRRVMKRASLKASTTSGSGGGSSALYAGLGVGVLAAVGVLAIARSKKMT
jgi:hypothetical protein